MLLKFALSLLFLLPSLALGQRHPGMQDRGYKCEEPHYPAAAKRSGATGRTLLVVETDKQGQIAKVNVSRSSGKTREHKILDQAAVLHARSCVLEAGAEAKAGAFSFEVVWVLQ